MQLLIITITWENVSAGSEIIMRTNREESSSKHDDGNGKGEHSQSEWIPNFNMQHAGSNAPSTIDKPNDFLTNVDELTTTRTTTELVHATPEH